MNKTIGIVLALIVVGGVAYYAGTAGSKDAAMQGDTNAAGGTVETSAQNGEYTTVDPAMTGTWKSTEDPKFTREFKADGTMTDRYEGDASATETATFFTIDPSVVAVPGVPAVNLEGTTVIRVDFASGPMFFSINSLTGTELSMTNLSGRGNILMFTKVK